MRFRAPPAAGQVISIQAGYHSGWRARIGGRPAAVRRDGLGLMWLRPESPGVWEVELLYDGGWELRLCRWLGAAALAATVIFAVRGAVR
jgi:hypothetical protein